MNKVTGLAITLGILLAIVAGVVELPGSVPTAAVLVILGIIGGITSAQDGAMRIYLGVLVLPVVGSALGNIPSVGAYLNEIFSNLGIAAAGIAASLLARRVYEMAMGGITGLTAKE